MKKWLSKEFLFNRRVRKVGEKNAKLTLSIKALFDLCLESLRPLRLIVFILSCFWSYNAYSQIDCKNNTPLPPVLTSVSVQHETGNIKFTWTLSTSTNIAAYVLYTYKDGDAMPIDTLDPLATSYTFYSTVTKYFSTSYVVAAMRLPLCTSIFSNVLSTIFAEASVDTCNKKIIVSWNRYLSVPKKVTSYSILISVNGVNLPDTAKAGPEQNSYILPYSGTYSKYSFVVRANLEDGTVSTSNKAFPLPGVCTKPPVIVPPIIEPPVTESDTIVVPNVFTPNYDGVNDLFNPVLSFIPSDYHLIISDRRGNVLFERKVYDKSDAWDGSGKGNGVYLYFLKVTAPSGKIFSKRGTVTIINNRE